MSSSCLSGPSNSSRPYKRAAPQHLERGTAARSEVAAKEAVDTEISRNDPGEKKARVRPTGSHISHTRAGLDFP